MSRNFRSRLSLGSYNHECKSGDLSILRQNELSTNDRTAMIHQAFWLEYATLAWMTVEAAVAIASGIAANSLTLVCTENLIRID